MIHLTQPSHIPSALVQEKHLEWCYLGADIRIKKKTLATFPPDAELEIGGALNQVAEALRDPFLAWLDEIGKNQKDLQAWHATALASRSPLQSDLFQLVCYAQWIQRQVSSHSPETSRLIVIEDPWLYQTLRRNLKRKHLCCFPEYRTGVTFERCECLGTAIFAFACIFFPPCIGFLVCRPSFPASLSGSGGRFIV